MAGSTLFTTLDLVSGYWQVEVEPSDKEKTTFFTSKGHFEFNVMPFGLTKCYIWSAQRLMECVLAGLSGDLCLAYLDDIVFSTTFEEHLTRLETIFKRLY